MKFVQTNDNLRKRKRARTKCVLSRRRANRFLIQKKGGYMNNKIYVINGPNLNLLGKREPQVYGKLTLDHIAEFLRNKIEEDDFREPAQRVEAVMFQSNSEGELVDKIQEAGFAEDTIGIVLNAGAYSHYSYAIRDAIAAIPKPVIEVHISNIYAREEFRHTSVLSAVCKGVVCGLGVRGYWIATRELIENGFGA